MSLLDLELAIVDDVSVDTSTSGQITLENRLRRRGYRMTAQRRAIANALVGRNVHLTAEDVLARARVHHPGVSLATVYNCLTELVQLGELGQLGAGPGGATLYDPNVQTPHDHALCDACGQLCDVPRDPRRGAALSADAFGAIGFQASEAQVLFIGRCANCLDLAMDSAAEEPRGLK